MTDIILFRYIFSSVTKFVVQQYTSLIHRSSAPIGRLVFSNQAVVQEQNIDSIKPIYLILHCAACLIKATFVTQSGSSEDPNTDPHTSMHKDRT